MHSDTRTGNLLHEDHHRVMDSLNALDAWLERVPHDQPPALDAAEDRALVVSWAKEAADLDRHFALEEALFPSIAAAGAYELTAELASEHENLRPLARRLARLCDLALREGFDAETWPVFHFFGSELVGGLVQHIQKEEGSLIRATDAVLTPDLDAVMADSYELAEAA